jgi:hypothetical protein
MVAPRFVIANGVLGREAIPALLQEIASPLSELVLTNKKLNCKYPIMLLPLIVYGGRLSLSRTV